MLDIVGIFLKWKAWSVCKTKQNNRKVTFDFCIEKERKQGEEENERERDRESRLRATKAKSLFVKIVSDLNQAVTYHLAVESQTC